MINDEAKTFEVLKHDIAKYFPIRVVLRKTNDGKLQGLCEDSFSMSCVDNRVRIWWSGKAYSMLGEHILNGIADATHNMREGDILVDPLSEDCPITIDWERWTNATSKYDKRNAHFKLRDAE